MAFPYLFEENFSLGTRGNFSSESDSDGILDFPHYSVLARSNHAPYRGAYCLRVRPTGGTTDAYVQEDDGFDTSAGGTIWTRFYFQLGRDFTMADSDKFALVTLESAAGTAEVAAGIDRSGSNIRVWVAETAAASAQTMTLGTLDPPGHPNSVLNRWYALEIKAVIDSGGGNDGTIDAYLNNVQIGSQITGLDQGAIVHARFGIQGLDAGTTGTVLIDDIIADDGKIYPYKERFPHVVTLTRSAHVFVGPGHIASAALLTTGASNVMRLWDTDVANTDAAQDFVAELDLNVHTSVQGPLKFERGLYVTLAGTDPRGQVMLVQDDETPGVVGPLYYSERGMIHYGQLRKVKGYGI